MGHKLVCSLQILTDGILPTTTLQHGIDTLSDRPVRVFRARLAMSCIPTRCRHVKVVFRPKPGTVNAPEKFMRPIKLMFFMLKLFYTRWLVGQRKQ